MFGIDFSIADSEDIRAVSEDFWVMVPSLLDGDPTIRFVGRFRDPETGNLPLGLDFTYELAVTPMHCGWPFYMKT